MAQCPALFHATPASPGTQVGSATCQPQPGPKWLEPKWLRSLIIEVPMAPEVPVVPGASVLPGASRAPLGRPLGSVWSQRLPQR
eukprot:14683278-Alexandrium_andersonii.AAC.1